MNFLLAALLVLRLNPGNAEVEDDEEEITQFLFDYAAHLSDDLTEYYYYDNSTVIPTMYTYEMDSYETNTIWDWFLGFSPEDSTNKIAEAPHTDAPEDSSTKISEAAHTDAPEDSRNAEDTQDSQDSAGSALQCHLPLVTLLSLLGLLL